MLGLNPYPKFSLLLKARENSSLMVFFLAIKYILSILATAGEEGRKCLMREIELGKIIGDSNQPNIVKFIGCVTRQGTC